MCPAVMWSRLPSRTPDLGAFFLSTGLSPRLGHFPVPLPVPLHFGTTLGQAHDHVLMLLTLHPKPSDF